MKKVAIAGLLLMVALSVSVKAGPQRFDQYDFSFDGAVRDLVTEDINGDGLVDIAAVVTDFSKDPPKRELVIMFCDRERGFHKGNMVTWPFPAKVAAVDIGDVTADPGKELVFIIEDGVYAASVQGGKVGPLTEVLKAQSLVALPYKKDVPYYNFVRDYTGDGLEDIMVTGFYNTTLAVRGEGYTFKNQVINLTPEIDIDAFDFQGMMGAREDLPFFRVAYNVPVVYAVDHNGDGKVDLVVGRDGDVEIFEQGPGGFSKDPVKKFKIVLFEDPEDKKKKDQGPPLMLQFVDFDKDGKIDILANQVHGRPPKMEAKTQVYLGKTGAAEKGKPDFVFETDKPGMGAAAQDVNNDGLLDIHMGTINIGLWTASRALLTGDVTVEMAYFFQRRDNTFPSRPDAVVPTDLKVNATKFSLESGIPNFYGDFNGDGFPDQALGENENLLALTLRDREGKPVDFKHEINVPVSMAPKVVDINRDGYSDLIIHYRERDEYIGAIHIFINKGKGSWPSLAEVK